MIGVLLLLAVFLSLIACYAVYTEKLVPINRGAIRSVFKPKSWKYLVYSIAVLLSCLGVVSMLYWYYQKDVFFITKRLLVVALLWPVAASDYKEYRIPNRLLIAALIARTVLIIPEGIFYGKEVLWILLREIIACVASIAFCGVTMLISQGSLGMGDLKLFAVMAVFLGIEGICYASFLSIFVAFMVAIVLLLAKKKGRKDAIPFAPFILIGTILSIILSGT